jgi:hypothetical protein
MLLVIRVTLIVIFGRRNAGKETSRTHRIKLDRLES